MIYTSNLNGEDLTYTDETVFLVQVGRGNGAYKTRYSFKGSLGQAVMYYNGINIGNGYKKRLLMPSRTERPLLARQFS